jgi:hypothetical protein
VVIQVLLTVLFNGGATSYMLRKWDLFEGGRVVRSPSLVALAVMSADADRLGNHAGPREESLGMERVPSSEGPASYVPMLPFRIFPGGQQCIFELH